MGIEIKSISVGSKEFVFFSKYFTVLAKFPLPSNINFAVSITDPPPKAMANFILLHFELNDLLISFRFL